MCNLYSMTKSQAAIRELTRAMNDRTGNLPPLPGIFPDKMAPIVRNGEDGQRELLLARWGMPSPPKFVSGIDRGVTNIRNVSSPHWRGWMKPEFRCLVPATSFCEYTDTSPKVPTWFALGEDRPLFFFAGIWCKWAGVRGTKANPEARVHTLFGFLTTEANEIVRPVHAKAMPVILTQAEEFDRWLSAPAAEALTLQRPPPADALRIVARERGRIGGLVAGRQFPMGRAGRWWQIPLLLHPR
jgi:putative SOS response-associated peptidase YedK